MFGSGGSAFGNSSWVGSNSNNTFAGNNTNTPFNSAFSSGDTSSNNAFGFPQNTQKAQQVESAFGNFSAGSAFVNPPSNAFQIGSNQSTSVFGGQQKSNPFSQPTANTNQNNQSNNFSSINHFQGNKQPQSTKPYNAFNKSRDSAQALDLTRLKGGSGFKSRTYVKRQTPAYLLPGQSPAFEINRQPDEWDRRNQEEMFKIEQTQGSNLQVLYEMLQAKRETERVEMERRGLVDKQDVRKDLKDAIRFVGSCMSMCPTFERIRRTYENNVKQLEKDPNTGKATSQYAVKAFSRPAAGQPPPLPSDVRPPAVLRSTLEYLIQTAIPQLPFSHSFLWDRTRSVRQDFTYQNYAGDEAVECNELIARIHLICLHVMAGSDQDYSKQQEVEQFNKTLQTLSELYAERRKRGLPDSAREPEIRAYQLLSHVRDPDIERQIQKLPERIVNSPEVTLALKLRGLIQQNGMNIKYSENAANYFAVFFQEFTKAPFLIACLIESSLVEFRVLALRSLSRAIHSRGKPYFVSRLRDMLAFDTDDETVELCTHYKLPLKDDGIDVSAFNDQLVADCVPLGQPFSQIVEQKLKGRNLVEIVSFGDTYHGLSMVADHSESVKWGQELKARKQIPPIPSTVYPKADNAMTPTSSFGKAVSLSGNSLPNSITQTQSDDVQRSKPQVDRANTSTTLFSTPVVTKAPPRPRPRAESVVAIPPKDVFKPEKQLERPKPSLADINRISSEECEILLKQFVQQAISSTAVPFVWKEIGNAREYRRNVIESHARGVLNSIISDLVQSQTKMAAATKFDEKRCMKRALKAFCRSGLHALDKARLKRKWADELVDVGKKLGRSNSGRKRVPLHRARSISHPDVDSQIAMISAGPALAEELWRPLDLTKVLFEPIDAGFKQRRTFDRRFAMAVFSENWSGPTGSWMRTKLSMTVTERPSRHYEKCIEKNGTIVKLWSLINDASLCESTGALVFECGLESIEVDRERIHEISQFLQLSNYKVKILAVYFGDLSENQVRLELRYPAVSVCKIGGAQTSERFSAALTELAESYQAERSAKGQVEYDAMIHERDLAAERRKREEEDSGSKIAQKVEDERFHRLKKFKALSLHKSLIGDSAIPSSAKTDLSSSADFVSKISVPPFHSVSAVPAAPTTGVPKSIEALNALVALVKRPQS